MYKGILIFVYKIVYIYKSIGLKSIFINFFFQIKIIGSKIIISINLFNGHNIN